MNFNKTLCLPAITWNKKTSIEPSRTDNIHPGEKFFIVATFEGLWVVWVFFGFPENISPMNIVYEKQTYFPLCR